MIGDEEGLLHCKVCSATIRDRDLEPGEELRCRRCGSMVKARDKGHLMHVAWALATTGLLLCVLANSFPVLTFDVAGNTQSNLIITGVIGLMKQGYWPVAALVFFCAIAAPVLHFGAIWYVAGSCTFRHHWPLAGRVAVFAEKIGPWSLVPVFAIACVVAVVKLRMLGTVFWDVGILWIALLALCSLALRQVFDHEFAVRHLRTTA